MNRPKFFRFALLLTISLLFADFSYAATIEVTTTTDEYREDEVASGCSLREAIRAANGDDFFGECPAGSGDDVIRLPAGNYSLTLDAPPEDLGVRGDLDIFTNITIEGSGLATTVITSPNSERIFHIRLDATVVRITGVTLQNGLSDGSGELGSGGCILNRGQLVMISSQIQGCRAKEGGGIYNTRSLRLEDVVVENNIANRGGAGLFNTGDRATAVIARTTIRANSARSTTVGGAGIYNDVSSRLNISRSTFNNNEANSDGGGVSSLGILWISQSTFGSNNLSERDGGGVFINSESESLIHNSTFQDNMADRDGGAVFKTGGGTLNIRNATIANNTADINDDGVGTGGGLAVLGGALFLRNSIVARNDVNGNRAAVGAECSGTVSSSGHNIVRHGVGCDFRVATNDLVGVDVVNVVEPRFSGSLRDHGGATQTIAIGVQSPAIDAGDSVFCEANFPSDQRDQPRQGICDIGAYEVRCGDGSVAGSEGCDDGNEIDNDACRNFCALATCGDGVVNPGEGCDDGNLASNDGCSDTCVAEAQANPLPGGGVGQGAGGGEGGGGGEAGGGGGGCHLVMDRNFQINVMGNWFILLLVFLATSLRQKNSH